jgi:hypothetical protein
MVHLIGFYYKNQNDCVKSRAKTWYMINHYQLLCQWRNVTYGREKQLKQYSLNQHKKDSKVSPVHAIKVYGGIKGTTPLILNLNTRWR